MSFIPSSAMPHAKPHDEHDPEHKPEHGHTPEQGQMPEHGDKPGQVAPSDHRQENGAGKPQSTAPQPASPEPQPALAAPTPSSDRQGPETKKAPWGIALAIGGVLAIGAATAVLFRGESKPAKKDADQPVKAKRKGKKSPSQ